jgi:hypothetical protein
VAGPEAAAAYPAHRLVGLTGLDQAKNILDHPPWSGYPPHLCSREGRATGRESPGRSSTANDPDPKREDSKDQATDGAQKASGLSPRD